jgi:hypothetical protein
MWFPQRGRFAKANLTLYTVVRFIVRRNVLHITIDTPSVCGFSVTPPGHFSAQSINFNQFQPYKGFQMVGF